MKSAFEDIDYKNNIFDYPDLTRIIGEPTTSSLITLRNEVKANAQSVHSTLGGGENGHLGLVCSPEIYNTIVPGETPYVRPNNPGPLNIQGDETQFQIAQRRDEHAEATRLFREVLGVERALIQQIVTAVEAKYLKALRNSVTNKITKTIPEIFHYLFETYGDVSPQELKALTSQVEALHFPPNEPVDTVFTEIDDLATIAELARAPISDQQKINMAYLILQNAQVYNNALTKWNQFDYAQHTWENFKVHFRDAQKALRRKGALTIQDTMNHIDIINLVQQGVQQALEHNKQAPPKDDNSSNNHTPFTQESIPIHDANSVTSNITLQTMQQQIDMMAKMMDSMRNLQTSTSTSTRRFKRNPNQSLYCWTHGLCSHTGETCRTPADVHQKEATLDNRMGGSSKNIKST